MTQPKATQPSFTDVGADILLFRQLLSPEVCQQIIQVAEWITFDPSSILMGTVDPEVRSGGILPLDAQHPVQRSTQQLLYEKIQLIQRALYQHYGIKFPQVEGFSILRYRPGESYRRHVDNLLLASRMMELAQGIPTRDISIVGYLNDEFEGGETYFDRQDIKIKPATGDVIAFPSYYTHPHAALPVTQGTKYAFTTWLFY
ncbi:2OG-Fe(II) oxygenase [Candidatus Synechococcus calcipolaris G9]|uniref:2OG-Fe(II) oxygenase n=1 Tax=Candidatus Synechococcus calcipolaris G9 TaxID=1497997 RepID=A0ABT6EY29_9SYNE|nr:2OG-Fe(II) oxygenase [Candidatus Synechococcus calcipolaris]MDG2990706.1 2OG-Fe(II) oxygenase [Candidatus Synechococcus calcipolaris G9]